MLQLAQCRRGERRARGLDAAAARERGGGANRRDGDNGCETPAWSCCRQPNQRASDKPGFADDLPAA
jgi:hypothetical protein